MADEEVQKENNSEAAEADAAGGSADPEQMSEAELREALEQQFRQQKVSDMLMQYMAGLSHIAYVKMGLTEDSDAFKDMAQASLAIDVFKAMLETAHDRLDPQDANALAGALASMQMTFAQAGGVSGEDGAGKAEAAADDEKPGSSATDRLWVPGKD
ncbi:MAG: DUF1844 domain-containing protein [Thermoleophilia bacterium]